MMGVLDMVLRRETAIYDSQTAFYNDIALIIMILRSYLSYLQWWGYNTVLYWKMGWGECICLRGDWARYDLTLRLLHIFSERSDNNLGIAS